jgi:AdoMet-dependent heme synthase
MRASEVTVRPTGDLFAKTPFIVFWETTRACDLVCVHCRACAIPRRDPRELSTQEGKDLLTEIRDMGCPLVVLTGGDPAKRPDLVELVRHGNAEGLRMALTPSATPLIDRSLLESLRDAGLARLAVSLDGATAATHDGFRGVQGSFDRTFEILRAARELGLTTQINTTISEHNIDDLERIAALCADLDIELWSVFLLVPTGRGVDLDILDPDRVESLLQRLARIAPMAPFDVKTTAAPHFRRILLQQKVARDDITGLSEDGIGRAPRGVNDGQGIAFVSHVGDIYPSGFLPIRCGNVRDGGLTRTYRMHPLFRELRDPDLLGGKCGVCEFRRVCGGSRARAHAMNGDPLSYDPSCAYLPRRWPAEAEPGGT